LFERNIALAQTRFPDYQSGRDRAGRTGQLGGQKRNWLSLNAVYLR
jgi:hypothetical protein